MASTSDMASIREHVSWVTADRGRDGEGERAHRRRGAARCRARAAEPRRVPVHPDVLVVGGGIGGIHWRAPLPTPARHVYLVEREPCIGGHMAKLTSLRRVDMRGLGILL